MHKMKNFLFDRSAEAAGARYISWRMLATRSLAKMSRPTEQPGVEKVRRSGDEGSRGSGDQERARRGEARPIGI